MQVAVHGEVMVAISNANYAQPGGMLDTWAESVLRAGVKNAMVVALDEATKAHAESKGLPAFQMTLEVSCTWARVTAEIILNHLWRWFERIGVSPCTRSLICLDCHPNPIQTPNLIQLRLL